WLAVPIRRSNCLPFIFISFANRCSPLLLLFGRKIEWVAFGTAHLCRLLRLGLGNIAGIDRDHTSPLLMCGYHYFVGMAFVHPENGLEDQHYELARRIVVIE